jgi:hypothetical protein
MHVIQRRTYTPHGTYSDAYVVDGLSQKFVFDYKILELPWKQNQRSISCIPEGTYDVVKEGPTEKRPYVYFRILNVPDRSGILMHRGNYTRQILGCQLPGEKFVDLNKDGMLDVTNTTGTLEKLADILPAKFKLMIQKA